MAVAIPRPNWTRGQSITEWMAQELQRNPAYQLPRGYTQEDDGSVSRDQGNWLMRNPWAFPLMGIGAGLGLPALLGMGGGGGGAAAGAGAAGLTEAGIPTTIGMGGGGGGAAAGAGAAAGGRTSWLGPVLGAVAGLVGRSVTPQRSTQVPIPPELQQLLTEATRRQMNQGPLSDAVTRQALAGLPRYAR